MNCERIILVPDVSADRPAFLAERSKRIGGSDITAVCGLSNWRSPLAVWCEKTGKIKPSEEESDAMFLGNELEPVVAKMFTRKVGVPTIRAGSMLTRSDLPWAVATPDYLYSVEGEPKGPHPVELLECKTTAFGDDWEGDNIPDHAHTQLMWQMGISGYTAGSVAALIGGRVFKHKRFEFDEALFAQLVEAGQKFMDLIEKDIPPAARVSSDEKLLEAIHGAPIDGKIFELAPEWMPKIEEYQKYTEGQSTLDKTSREMKKKREAIRAEIHGEIGNASIAKCGDAVIELTKNDRKGHTVAPYSFYQMKVERPEADGAEG